MKDTRDISIDEALKMQANLHHDCFVAPFEDTQNNNAMKGLFTTPLATISKIQSKVEEIAWGFTAGMDVKKGQDELAKLISYMDKETKRLGEERDNGQFIKDFKPSELRFIYDFVKKADESGIDFSEMSVSEFNKAADNIINQLKEH